CVLGRKNVYQCFLRLKVMVPRSLSSTSEPFQTISPLSPVVVASNHTVSPSFFAWYVPSPNPYLWHACESNLPSTNLNVSGSHDSLPFGWIWATNVLPSSSCSLSFSAARAGVQPAVTTTASATNSTCFIAFLPLEKATPA